MNDEITVEGSGFTSHLAVTGSPRPQPSDNLGSRQALCRQLAPVPTLKDLTRHAEKFGTEQVVETAAECGYGFDTLVRLQDAVDRIDQARWRREHPHAPLPRVKPSEERVRVLLGLEKEELAEAA